MDQPDPISVIAAAIQDVLEINPPGVANRAAAAVFSALRTRYGFTYTGDGRTGYIIPVPLERREAP